MTSHPNNSMTTEKIGKSPVARVALAVLLAALLSKPAEYVVQSVLWGGWLAIHEIVNQSMLRTNPDNTQRLKIGAATIVRKIDSSAGPSASEIFGVTPVDKTRFVEITLEAPGMEPGLAVSLVGADRRARPDAGLQVLRSEDRSVRRVRVQAGEILVIQPTVGTPIAPGSSVTLIAEEPTVLWQGEYSEIVPFIRTGWTDFVIPPTSAATLHPPIAQTGNFSEPESSAWYVVGSRELSGDSLLVADLGSADFDAFLEVYRVEEEQLTRIAQDDDDGEGHNSRIVLTEPKTESLLVRVTALGEGVGGYDLQILESSGFGRLVAGLGAPSDLEPITSRVHSGILSGTDIWKLMGPLGGCPVKISLSSNSFDPVVRGWTLSRTEVVDSGTNDDGGSGNNSELTLYCRPSEESYALIKVGHYGDSSTGSFELRLDYN